MTEAASSRKRRAGWPYPAEASRLTRAARAMPMPHAVSTTLCLRTFSATANVTACMASSAPAVTSRVTPNGPAGTPLTVSPDGEDLVDAHPAFLEGQRAARQVRDDAARPRPPFGAVISGPG